MIDVFICSTASANAPADKVRHKMLELCLARWEQEPEARVQVITPYTLRSTARAFQRDRRIYADQHADSSIYVCADDDALLPKNFSLIQFAKLLTAYPRFAVLAPLPSNCHISPWTPEGYSPTFNADVMEHVSVGMARVSRKGALKVWPPMEAIGPAAYDTEHCEAIRNAGLRSGYARNFTCIHLGEGTSSVWAVN